MLGTTSGKHVYDVGENLNYSSDVTCVVNMFGVNDMTQSPKDAATLLGQKDKDNQESMRVSEKPCLSRSKHSGRKCLYSNLVPIGNHVGICRRRRCHGC